MYTANIEYLPYVSYWSWCFLCIREGSILTILEVNIFKLIYKHVQVYYFYDISKVIGVEKTKISVT